MINISLFFDGIEAVVSNYNDLPQCNLDEIYRSRKEIFIDRKSWDIGSYKGGDFECDRYDDEEAYYIYILNERCVTGCVRLRPSSSPTLMTGALKWLKEPVENEVSKLGPTWEASRFFITQVKSFCREKGTVDRRTHALFILMIEFGMAKNFENYEVVVDAVMMRILRMCGWPIYVMNSGLGSLSEKVYYGLLPCDLKALNKVLHVTGQNRTDLISF